MNIVLPRKGMSPDEREVAYNEFVTQIQELSRQIGFKVSARGWCYQMESFRLINKDEFDRVEKIINKCRKNGLLPIDFTAEEDARKFSGVETEETETPIAYMRRFLRGSLNCGSWYTPDWWDGEDYYIQMLVEKVDLKTLFKPVCEEYHIPVATCVDNKTEILTIDGWKFFQSLTKSDKVATMDKTGRLVYSKPTRIISEYYNGKMYQIKNRATDQLVTPNHRVYIKRQKNNKKNEQFEICPVSEVVHLQNLKFKRNIVWKGKKKSKFVLPLIESNGGYNKIKNKLDMNTWLQFLGYYISEGSSTKIKNHQYRVQLAQRNPTIKRKMIECVKKLGYNFYTDWQSVQITNKQLYTYLTKLGKSYEKYIPKEYLELPPGQLRILLDALIEGDGHRRKTNVVYITSSKELANNVQELALKSGYYASISLRTNKGSVSIIEKRTVLSIHPTYSVNICQAHKEFHVNHGKKDWKIVEYSGTIHCVEVPSGLIYVRRNGKSVWTGNSKGWSSMFQRAEYARRFQEAEDMGLTCVLLYCGDHDPDGLRISDFIRKNLHDISDVMWDDGTSGYDPSSLIIDRFGLNDDFIKEHNLTWIDNLITGTGRNLASSSHKNFHMDYVQDYLKKFGPRKCEANAIVPIPQIARDFCREIIEGGNTDREDNINNQWYGVGEEALDRFAQKRQEIIDELTEFRERTGIEKPIREAIKAIDEEVGEEE